VAVLGDDIVQILWHLSPRVVLVAAGQDQIVMQDLHDTCAEREARPNNIIHKRIISSAGKEALGGGVFVGITSTLLDALLAFEPNRSWVSTATVTTGDSLGVTLIDSAGTLLTDGVGPGDWVINLTDGSLTSIITVESEGQATMLRPLGAGSDNQFDIGDDIRILKVDQKSAAGGNLVSIDALGDTQDPVLPTAGNQVVRTSSSSATALEQLDVQHSSFDGAVLVDPNNDTGLAKSGTLHPAGTGRQPVDNFPDALAIASARGLKELRLLGTGLVMASGDFRGLRIRGQFTVATELSVGASSLVDGCEFLSMTLSGTMDGSVLIKSCLLDAVDGLAGFVENSGLRGVLTMSGTDELHLVRCHDAIAGVGAPAIDCGGVGNAIIIRDYQGAIAVRNKSGSEEVSIDLMPGRLILESTVSGGDFIVKGVGPPVDNQSVGSVTVDEDGLVPGPVSASDLRKLLFAILGNVV